MNSIRKRLSLDELLRGHVPQALSHRNDLFLAAAEYGPPPDTFFGDRYSENAVIPIFVDLNEGLDHNLAAEGLPVVVLLEQPSTD